MQNRIIYWAKSRNMKGHALILTTQCKKLFVYCNLRKFQNILSRDRRSLGSGRKLGPPLGHALAPSVPLLLEPLCKQLLVLCSLRLLLGDPLFLVSNSSTLPLECHGSHQTLDLRSLARLLTFLVNECPAVCVDVIADIIILSKVEELLDLGSSLGSPHPGLLSVSKARQIILTLLDNHQVNN